MRSGYSTSILKQTWDRGCGDLSVHQIGIYTINHLQGHFSRAKMGGHWNGNKGGGKGGGGRNQNQNKGSWPQQHQQWNGYNDYQVQATWPPQYNPATHSLAGIHGVVQSPFQNASFQPTFQSSPVGAGGVAGNNPFGTPFTSSSPFAAQGYGAANVIASVGQEIDRQFQKHEQQIAREALKVIMGNVSKDSQGEKQDAASSLLSIFEEASKKTESEKERIVAEHLAKRARAAESPDTAQLSPRHRKLHCSSNTRFRRES